jgi:TPR repeat protein
LPHNFFVQTLYRYAHIAKRQGDWSQAVDLWERAASENEIIACIEIAKYYEHIDQRLEQALNWTSKALENLAIYPMPHYMVEEFSKQLEHRKNRILRKLETGK